MPKLMNYERDGRVKFLPWFSEQVCVIVRIQRMSILALDEMANLNPDKLSSDELTSASEIESFNRKLVTTCNGFLENGDYSRAALLECFTTIRRLTRLHRW